MFNKPTSKFAKRLAELMFTSLRRREIKAAIFDTSNDLIVQLDDGSVRDKKIGLSITDLAYLERRITVGTLLIQGYSLKYDNRNSVHVCTSGKGEQYILEKESCDCKDFSYRANLTEPCKHLLFRDGFLELCHQVNSDSPQHKQSLVVGDNHLVDYIRKLE